MDYYAKNDNSEKYSRADNSIHLKKKSNKIINGIYFIYNLHIAIYLPRWKIYPNSTYSLFFYSESD